MAPSKLKAKSAGRPWSRRKLSIPLWVGKQLADDLLEMVQAHRHNLDGHPGQFEELHNQLVVQRFQATIQEDDPLVAAEVEPGIFDGSFELNDIALLK